MFKKIFKFIIILLPFFLSTIIYNDYSFYKTINKPFFALPSNLFGIVWPILYILVAISIYIVTDNYLTKDYKKSLLYNYIFNQLYTIIFFMFKNPFLAFVDTILALITSLFLYYETKSISKKASKFLIPYVIFLVYAFILSTSIYFLNL